MIGRIIEWSARHIGAVLFTTAVVVATGLYALMQTPLGRRLATELRHSKTRERAQ